MYLPHITITIPEEKVLRYLRFRSKDTLSKEWEMRIRDGIKMAKTILSPKGIIQSEETCPELLDKWEWGSSRFGGGKVRKVTEKGRRVTFIAATIGQGLEDLIEEYIQKRETTMAYLLDVVGTVAVHQTVEQLKKIISPQVKKEGCHLSPRMAPGYGDWKVEAQSLFFKYLELGKLHLQINKEGIITPKHTLTGLYAWTNREQKVTIPCHICSKKNCIYRV